MTRILAVASEIFPLVKTGGLADVTGALPLALTASGVETVTLVPGYPAVLCRLPDARKVHHFDDLFGGPAAILSGSVGGLELLAIDAPHLYDRDGNPYSGPNGQDWADNGARFAALGAAAAALAVSDNPSLGFDVLHAHDWQAAMAVVYLAAHPGRRPGTVLTIHNLAFQGMFPAALFPQLGLPPGMFSVDGLEFYGIVNFLKGALMCADRLTTVSPTYAREITRPDNGAALDGVLRRRAAVLSGILNGIDDSVWNPATDSFLPSPFSLRRLSRRSGNKVALQQRMGLRQDPTALLVGVVSRLTQQKGLDQLAAQLEALFRPRAETTLQMVILGSGDAAMEHAFTAAATTRPDQIGCVIGYDEPLAHLIQAGSDALLVPSRFEPCGLTQMCALRYGAIPIVSRVGGLADTVIDANVAALTAGVATGIQFLPVTAEAMADALDRTIMLWEDRPAWQSMQRNAMSADVSWSQSAGRYATLYQSLTERS